jgi:hypothetical protein
MNQQKLSKRKVLIKGVEPPAVIGCIAVVVISSLELCGIKLTAENIVSINALSVGLYGIYCSWRNYRKNK